WRPGRAGGRAWACGGPPDGGGCPRADRAGHGRGANNPGGGDMRGAAGGAKDLMGGVHGGGGRGGWAAGEGRGGGGCARKDELACDEWARGPKFATIPLLSL